MLSKQAMLANELRRLKAKLGGISEEDDELTYFSTSKRVADVERSLAELADADVNPRFLDYALFDGEKVVGSHSADAVVAGDTLAALGRALAAESQARVAAALAEAKAKKLPPPNLAMFRPATTGSIHSSFGFRIVHSDPVPTGPVDYEAIARLRTAVVRLISEDGDDAVQEELGSRDRTTRGAIRAFIEALSKASVGVKFGGEGEEVRCSRESVERAWGRIGSIRDDVRVFDLFGVLEGVLPNKRRYEFRPKETPGEFEFAFELISGKLHATLTEDEVALIASLSRDEVWGRFRMVSKSGAARQSSRACTLIGASASKDGLDRFDVGD